jgi:hypothetical protein
MYSNSASDDLKAIRQIMERTSREASGSGGWFMVLWGCIWFFGFLGNQFLPANTAGYVWMGLTAVGTAGSLWIGVRLSRYTRVRSTVWRPITLGFIALFAFVLLIAWLFRLSSTRDISLLIVLTIALCYVLVGLFTHGGSAIVGVILAALTVGAVVLLPNFFFLAMAFLSGGLLIASGLLYVRRKE